MILIVCVDDHNGMMFNHRRQSQDRILRGDILELAEGKILWMDAYSKKQFVEEGMTQIRVEEDFLQKAGEGEFCFAEDADLSSPERSASSALRKMRIFPGRKSGYRKSICTGGTGITLRMCISRSIFQDGTV